MANNYFINLFSQLATLILSLFVTAYLSRILGVDQYGLYTYLITIASFFSLFCMSGIRNYGPRKIAQSTNNVEQNFNKIYSFQILSTVIVCIILAILYIIFQNNSNTLGLIVLITYIIGISLNPSWYFQGIGKLGFTSIINFIIQVLNLILIFFFINDSSSILPLLLIVSFIACLNAIVQFVVINRKHKFYFDFTALKDTFIEINKFFVPLFFISIYTIMDKILLGYLSNYSQIAYYTNAITIVKITTVIFNSANAIVMPTLSQNIDNKQYYSDIVNNMFNFAIISSFVLISMIITMSIAIVMIIFGSSYIDMVPIMIILSPLILLLSFGSIIALQHFTAVGENKKFTNIVAIGALVNLVLNILLIPKFGAIGATIGTLISEIVVTTIGLYYVRNLVEIKKKIFFVVKCIIPLIISIVLCIPMYAYITSYITICIIHFVIIVVVFALFILLNDLVSKEKILKPLLNTFRTSK